MDERDGVRPVLDRRRLLLVSAATAGAAWVAPSVASVDAAAAATCLPPAPLAFRQSRADGSAAGTTTVTVPVPSGSDPAIPTTGTNVAHVAVVNVDHIIDVAQPDVSPVDPGWTLLGSFDSDVTTPGTAATGSVNAWSQRLFVWARTADLQGSYQFDVTLSGNGFYTPQIRAVVAAYQYVRRVADDAGEVALQGSGLLDPTQTPPVSNPSPIPAITTDASSSIALAVTGAGNVSSSNTADPPTDYSTAFAANDGLGYPPIFLFSRSITGTGPIAATTATVLPGAQNVGGHMTLEC